MDIKGHIRDSFGLELNLRQLNDGLDVTGKICLQGRQKECVLLRKQVMFQSADMTTHMREEKRENNR